MSGATMACAISRCSSAMTSFGVPAGTTAKPRFARNVGITSLCHGGDVGQRLRAGLARDRRRPQLPAFARGRARSHGAEGNRRVARDRRGNCRAAAIEWYVYEVEAERQAEQLAHEMGRRTYAGRGVAV